MNSYAKIKKNSAILSHYI